MKASSFLSYVIAAGVSLVACAPVGLVEGVVSVGARSPSAALDIRYAPLSFLRVVADTSSVCSGPFSPSVVPFGGATEESSIEKKLRPQ